MRSVPVLQHERRGRWPMILWQAGTFDPQPKEAYQRLLARGLTQHIHLDEKMIPTAKALQDAGSPVIMMEGQSGPFPYRLAGEKSEWAHQFDPGFTPKEEVHACPAITRGWAVNADRIRATLRRFKEAGVTVNAVWMDWEVEPVMGEERYEQAMHCARCRATLPRQVLSSEWAFDSYCTRKYIELTGTYMAAPVAEIFPGCSTTNWSAVVAAPSHPVFGWYQEPFVSRVPPMFTATNPAAYGMTFLFNYWKRSFPLDREHVDQFYTHFLLRTVSADTANRQIFAPHMQSVPWVARWCMAEDREGEARPIMTRERYREALRHLWLRGIDAMQVFNPAEPGFEQMAVWEVLDAVSVYDEMLEFADLLDGGEPLNLGLPKMQDSGVLWSGVRKHHTAIVRTFKPSGGAGEITLNLWSGKSVSLGATGAGQTFRVSLEGEKIVVRVLGEP